MDAKEQSDALFGAIEQSGQLVALLTGTKIQFINSGWSEAGAEAATIAILQHGKN